MKKLKNLFFLVLAVASFSLTGCLHIVEELTTRANGSGTYKLTFDMSEMKSMVDMVKSMAADSLGQSAEGGMPGMDNPMSMLGMKGESMGLMSALKSVPGVSNINEVTDTVNFISTFSFDFADAAALNRAVNALFKDRFDQKITDPYEAAKKKFVRNATGDFGAMFRSALGEAMEESGDEGAGMGDMASMFFSTMTYKQVYNFPDRTVKKSTNPLSQISADGHTVTIELKPFDAEQQKQNAGIATSISLKK